jgi:hypothetical protein
MIDDLTLDTEKIVADYRYSNIQTIRTAEI